MKKTNIFVLDTNVLITDPSAFLVFSKNDEVVIPYKVIEELEKHKLDANSVGVAVKECSRKLMAVIEDKTEKTLKDGIELNNGSILKVINSMELNSDSTVGPLVTGDDHILAACVHLSKDENNKVTLVSNDMLLNIRASSFNIPYKNHFISDQIRSLEDLYSGYQFITVDDEVQSKYWEECEEGSEVFSVTAKELGLTELNPNELVILNQNKKKTKKPWAILKTNEDGKTFGFVRETKLDKLKALNVEQYISVDLLTDSSVQLVSLMGPSGTGKTILAVEAGLKQVLSDKTYKNLLVLRPIQPVGKDIGYLPGEKSEKLEPWIAPIKDNLRFLLGENGKKTKNGENKLQYYFEQGIIEVEAMAYIRGRSINNAFIIVDEAQNISLHELKTILTRVGKGTKIVLTGDVEQIDRHDVNAITNGLAIAIERFKKYKIAGHVTLKESVRSELAALSAKIL